MPLPKHLAKFQFSGSDGFERFLSVTLAFRKSAQGGRAPVCASNHNANGNGSNDMQDARPLSALFAVAVTFIAFDSRLARAFTESITAGPDGTLYLSSLASGASPGSSPAHRKPRGGSHQEHSTAARHLESLPMQSQTPYGSARMMCRVGGSLAQVLRLAVTSRASIWRWAKARLAHSSPAKPTSATT
jgi:hypothetical protein